MIDQETGVTWLIDDEPVPYPDAVSRMEARAEAIRAGTASERVWLLEHPPLYTAGTSARDTDLLVPDRFPVYRTGRGGQFTYHGPGQRIAYVMLDLKQRGGDIRGFVCRLEDWLIRTLAHFNVRGERRSGRIGIWVDLGAHGGRAGQEAKIAALGVRVRRWVTYHGVSINVSPDLEHFTGIVPCGLGDYGVTSLEALGQLVTLPELDAALMATWPTVFGDA